MLTTQKILRTLLLVCISISVTACGFHLRGSASLDSETLIHVLAPRGSFELQLKDSLSRSGAQLTGEAAVSDWQVVVTQARHRRDIGTLDNNGTVNSYRLVFTASYRVLNGQGELVKDTQTLIEDRQYVYDPVEVVETEFEEQALRDSMENDIALRIVRQLSVYSGSAANDSHKGQSN